MPYSKRVYGTKKRYRKYKRCVRKLKKKKRVRNPYAVCRKAVLGLKRNKKMGKRKRKKKKRR